MVVIKEESLKDYLESKLIELNTLQKSINPSLEQYLKGYVAAYEEVLRVLNK